MDRTEAVDREVGLPVGWFFPRARGNGTILTSAWCLPEVSSRSALACPDRDLASCCAGRIGHKDTLRAFASDLAHFGVWGDDRRGVAVGRLRPAVKIRGAIISRRGTRSIRSKGCRGRRLDCTSSVLRRLRTRAGVRDELASWGKGSSFATPAYGRRRGWRARPRVRPRQPKSKRGCAQGQCPRQGGEGASCGCVGRMIGAWGPILRAIDRRKAVEERER
jgi:hypothetical protein